MKVVYKISKGNRLTVVTDREEVTLDGEWQLDKENDLNFVIRKTKTQAGGEKLTLRTKLIKAGSNALAFSLDTQGKSGTHQAQWLELKGKWQADKYNRLQFLIKEQVIKNRPLTFQGLWEVRQNTLVYTYKKSLSGVKLKQSHDLYFKGYWQINQKNRLTYILDSENLSQFDFRAYLETPNLIGKRGQIKYRLGIGAKGDKLFKVQIISLYGVWKLNRKAGLSLVVDYAGAGTKAIDFGAFVWINEKTKVTLGLVSKQGKDTGISLTLNKSFFKTKAEWFLRAASQASRPGFEWGINLPW